MTVGDWITSYDRHRRRCAHADTELGRCTLRLKGAAGGSLTYQATLVDGRRIATADTLEELKVEAVYHVNRLAEAESA